jgi:uncharacterized phiE125 gp8 family phage protein
VTLRVVIKTPPALEPVSLADAKVHLRVTHSADDPYISSLIVVARRSLEALTQRALINRTYYGFADSFPAQRCIEMPFAPLVSVTAVSYIAQNSVSAVYTTFSSAYYEVDTTSEPGRIIRHYNTSWPAVWYEGNGVRVEFVAGHGATAENVPADIAQALLMLVGHWYTVRQPLLTSAAGTMEVPKGIEYLALPHKVWS